MNRDMDLIRALMLKLEALPVDGHSIFAIGPADEELAVEYRERRRWSWPEIVVAIITAGGVVAAATITAFGR